MVLRTHSNRARVISHPRLVLLLPARDPPSASRPTTAAVAAALPRPEPSSTPAARLPDGRAQLRRDAVRAGQADRPGTQVGLSPGTRARGAEASSNACAGPAA